LTVSCDSGAVSAAAGCQCCLPGRASLIATSLVINHSPGNKQQSLLCKGISPKPYKSGDKPWWQGSAVLCVGVCIHTVCQQPPPLFQVQGGCGGSASAQHKAFPSISGGCCCCCCLSGDRRGNLMCWNLSAATTTSSSSSSSSPCWGVRAAHQGHVTALAWLQVGGAAAAAERRQQHQGLVGPQRWSGRLAEGVGWGVWSCCR